MRAEAGAGAAGAEARIGPNAVTRTLEAVRSRRGEDESVLLGIRAGVPVELPAGMIPERWFLALVEELHGTWGEAEALAVLREAGSAVGAYVLRNRIPTPAQRLVRLLPPPLALPVLLSACARHAWTFAGSGTMRWRSGLSGGRVTLAGSPTCRRRMLSRPGGSFYVAAFEVLVRALVSPGAVVEEGSCVARGDDACRLRIRLPETGRWRPARFVSTE